MKKLLLIVLFLFVATGVLVWRYGRHFLETSAERAIIDALPYWVTAEDIELDTSAGRLTASGVRVMAPRGYDEPYIAVVPKIACSFGMKGKSIIDGIVVDDISARDAVIYIERNPSGELNLNNMGPLLKKGKTSHKAGGESSPLNMFKDREFNPAQMITFSGKISIVNGSIRFSDHYVSRPPFEISLEEVNGNIEIALSGDMTSVLSVGSKAGGIIGQDRSQSLDWVVSLNPAAKGLTMSNRFELNGIDIRRFRVYYDPYCPFIIDSCRVSGTVVADLDHGNIGSQNVLYLQGLRFRPKTQDQYRGWQTEMIPDILRYLSTGKDEIVFDFKVKGPVSEPRIYPGDRVKRAMRSMAVDKISTVLQGLTEEKEGAPADGKPKSGGKVSDTEQIVDVLKQFLN